MLESSGGLVGSSGEGGGKAVVGSSGSSIMAAGSIGGGGDDDKSGGELFESGGGGGNRWPRQETLALLKIRSDMDTAFRDSSLKGPLWEEVSRKMAELGYHRSGKKCKEKFENVYKYHKRTKEGRVGKSEGKTYRFFDQLEALEQHHPNSSPALPPPRAPPQVAVPVTMIMPAGATVPSSPQPINVVHVAPAPLSISAQPQQPQPPNVSSNNPTPASQVAQTPGGVQGQQQQTMPTHPSPIQMEHSAPSESPSATPSSSSSTSSDEEVMGRKKRKRKWKDFFERLMKEVIDKQEVLQKRFLEAVERREHDRMAREEAWKMQEIARLNREHEILVQERSMAAAKDAALISFLKKLSEQQQIPMQLPAQLQTQAQPPQQQDVPSTTTGTQSQQVQRQAQVQPQAQVHHNPVPVAPPPLPQPQPLTQFPPQQAVPAAQTHLVISNNVDVQKTNNGNGTGGDVQSPLPPSSSRWPKAEVQALINLRTNLDQKYQESGPKGPLWEEISASMRKLGYNRNAKRCKEKWENINKYFKKVKESNKKRPEDSKTCPYFHQLDALYREKNKPDPNTNSNTNSTNITSSYGHPSSNVNLGPIMAQTQQHWPNPGSDNAEHEDSDDDGDEDDDDDQGTGYEIVANNAAGATNANVNVNSNAGSISTTTTTATTTGHAE
ncbi:hypothetical protein Cgig2_017548 [Carnegiea gigantea]|uniref:Myb-like domain-containing protein n=1 Tax=Carnegiea gigantea TaxID=171969 RepID=A0A9Q1KNM3_9CARY|nr:hypothetical protein Cgig2_017548 [Carnegiea gigantea]